MRVGVAVLALFPGVLPPDPVEFMFTDTPALFPVLNGVTMGETRVIGVTTPVVVAHAGDARARGRIAAVAEVVAIITFLNCKTVPPLLRLSQPGSSRNCSFASCQSRLHTQVCLRPLP